MERLGVLGWRGGRTAHGALDLLYVELDLLLQRPDLTLRRSP